MAVEHRCQRHGRPAVASRVRLRPDGTQETEYLCELDLAEERMSSGFGGRSLFDDFFSDFFDQGRSAGRVSAPTRQVERVDVTQFFSDATRELLQRAAQTALEWGSLDLDTDHLLHAALRDDVVRHVLREIDLAEVLGFLRPVRTEPNSGRDCWSPVSLAKVLDGHLYPLSLGR